jgi:hypothetical protein
LPQLPPTLLLTQRLKALQLEPDGQPVVPLGPHGTVPPQPSLIVPQFMFTSQLWMRLGQSQMPPTPPPPQVLGELQSTPQQGWPALPQARHVLFAGLQTAPALQPPGQHC